MSAQLSAVVFAAGQPTTTPSKQRRAAPAAGSDASQHSSSMLNARQAAIRAAVPATLQQHRHWQARLQGVCVCVVGCLVVKRTSGAVDLPASISVSASAPNLSTAPQKTVPWHLNKRVLSSTNSIPHCSSVCASQVASVFQLTRDDVDSEGWQTLTAAVPLLLQQPSTYKPAVFLMMQFEVRQAFAHDIASWSARQAAEACGFNQ